MNALRGTGGLAITSFGEENLLNLANDRYDDESIAVHEFCHTIDLGSRPPRSNVANSPRPDLQERHRQGIGGKTPIRVPTPRNIGLKSARVISIATA